MRRISRDDNATFFRSPRVEFGDRVEGPNVEAMGLWRTRLCLPRLSEIRPLFHVSLMHGDQFRLILRQG